MFESYDDVLTVEEACEALKIGFNAMYELLNTGKIKGYRNGRVWRIPKAALVEYIRNCTNKRKASTAVSACLLLMTRE
jgi:excisionase family DNA binding protein